jgi:hypothetical protein
MMRHDIPEGLNIETYAFPYEYIYGENEQERGASLWAHE